jgi:hypothetical protein
MSAVRRTPCGVMSKIHASTKVTGNPMSATMTTTRFVQSRLSHSMGWIVVYASTKSHATKA